LGGWQNRPADLQGTPPFLSWALTWPTYYVLPRSVIVWEQTTMLRRAITNSQKYDQETIIDRLIQAG